MMGRASRSKKERISLGETPKVRKVRQPLAPHVTHEPRIPQNWPHGHVGVELTGDEHEECVKVHIHGYDHFLHTTTARELSHMLLHILDYDTRRTMLANYQQRTSISEG
jgi:hypothetical protein